MQIMMDILGSIITYCESEVNSFFFFAATVMASLFNKVDIHQELENNRSRFITLIDLDCFYAQVNIDLFVSNNNHQSTIQLNK